MMIPYTIIRSPRKTVGIYVTQKATVEVRAPLKLPQADIEKMVAEKEYWISPRLALSEQRQKEKAAFGLSYGDTVSLCGAGYTLCAGTGSRPVCAEGCFMLPPNLPPEELKRHVIRIYKEQAARILREKTAAYAPLLGVSPATIKINSAKTRWGSCCGKNRLNFSWLLVMADEDVVDYVVVHELAHIREHNHSPRFWEVVESIMPDYRQRRQKLKKFQDKLLREDWD